jgi:IS66 Orf2 like protein
VIGIPQSVRILIGSTPIDMRKSIDGLTAIVQEELGEDVYICVGRGYAAERPIDAFSRGYPATCAT